MNSCSFFGFNLGACVSGTVLGWIAAVPLWGWILIVLVVLGIAFKFAGWPGVVALAAALGYGARGVVDAEHDRQFNAPSDLGGDPIEPTASRFDDRPPPKSLTEK